MIASLLLLLLIQASERQEAIERNLQGIALRAEGKFREAAAVLEAAMVLAPDDVAIATNLAGAWNDEGTRLLRKESKLDAAIAAFEQAEKRIPPSPSQRLFRSEAFERRGDERRRERHVDKALDDYGKAIALNPDNLGAATAAAYVVFESEDFAEADRKLSAIARRSPGVAAIWLALAEARSRRGDARGAAQAMEHAAALDPESRYLSKRVARFRADARVEPEYVPSSSRHFRFLFPPRRTDLIESAERIARLLEDAYVRIGYEFGFYPEETTQVVFYEVPDFHAVTRADEWAEGLFDGKIRVAIREFSAQGDSLRRVLFHEYTHRLIRFVSLGQCPTWLNEGLAQISCEENVRAAESRLRRTQRAGLSPLELRMPFSGISNVVRVQAAYDQSLVLASALLEQRGRLSVLRYLQAIGGYKQPRIEEPKAFEREFGYSFETFVKRHQERK